MVTQEQLKKDFHYNPETGEFTRLKKGKSKVGTVITRKGSSHLRFRIAESMQYAHRMAWLYVFGSIPKDQIDHINGNSLDNRISNLRECNYIQNRSNTGNRKDNKTGYKGVSWTSEKGKYKAQIRYNDKYKHIGYYDSALEAGLAYQEEAKKLHGSFYKEVIE